VERSEGAVEVAMVVGRWRRGDGGMALVVQLLINVVLHQELCYCLLMLLW
jgi:hypothetical protein